MNDFERDDAFAVALEACRARVRAGESLAACLADYPPAYRDALADLLPAGDRVAGAARDPSQAFVDRFEPVLLEAVASARAQQRTRARRVAGRVTRMPMLRVAAVTVLAALVLGGGGVAVVDASGDALPGEPLYQVTELREAIEQFVSRSESARVAASEQRIARRTEELRRAVMREARPALLMRLERELGGEVRQLVERSIRLRERGDPRAAPRALETLRRIDARVERLRAVETGPEQRRVLARLDRFLAAQEQRLVGPP